ncbi:MAG: DMT family transporter [Desulfovibrionaceae bacterium]|nr:DMT family transporter [Desulfovibrionaceae bacterium]
MIWILATAFIWSFIGVFGKICLEAGMTPLQCALMRAFFGSLAFCIHDRILSRKRMPFCHAMLFTVFGIWGFGVYFAACQYTIRLAGAAVDIVLQYTAPFWVALFARIFFGESLTMPKLLCLASAAFGTALVCCSGGSLPEGFSSWGIATGLLSGLCYASHYPFLRYWQQRYDTVSIISRMLIGGTLFLALSDPRSLSGSFPVSIWLTAAASGVICTYVGYFCYGQALKRISLIRAAMISQLEPLLSVLWVSLLFGERFSHAGQAGSLIILLSVLALTLSDRD